MQMQKQTDQLLNADDLDTMWVCLRENCVVDDATGAEKVGLLIYYRNGFIDQIGVFKSISLKRETE